MIVCDSKKQSDCNNAKEKIDAIYSAVINGGSFEELAKESSNDRKSAQKGGELGGLHLVEMCIHHLKMRYLV